MDFPGRGKQTGRETLLPRVVTRLVAAPRAHAGPAGQMLRSGPGWAPLPWEGAYFPRPFSPKGISLPVSPVLCPHPTRELGFLWTSVATGKLPLGRRRATLDTHCGGSVQRQRSSAPRDNRQSEVLNTQFNLKQAQVQTIHKSF